MMVIRFCHFVFLVTAVVAWKALNPEEVLFGFSRCGEDFTPNDENREIRIQNWATWKLEPRDNWTMCYVKCCLEKLELLDPKTNKFMPKRVDTQYRVYGKYSCLSQNEVTGFKNALKELPKMIGCEQVFEAVTNQLSRYLPVVVKLFHGDPKLTRKIYATEGKNIKKKGQTYPEYCENRYFSKGSPAVCDFRQYGETNNARYNIFVLDCIFKGFRYLDKEGKIDATEIIRDFHGIGKKNLDVEIRRTIALCNVSNATKARDYYNCMIDSEILGGRFQTAYDYREVRSADYDYAFQIPGPPVYDVVAVNRKVLEIEAERCPNQHGRR